jgi:adenylosuccinate lyase
MITGTLARIGTEVYELQRPEIDELREPTGSEAVSSITMPHKRNPERSEHLDTLARLVRANAGVLLEGMVGQHERDGRSWKAEWVALPEVCLLTSAALQLAVELLEGLEVDSAAMLANLDSYTGSERALALLAPRLGRHAARSALQSALAKGRAVGVPMAVALRDAGLLTDAEAELLVPDTGAAGAMVDLVVGRGRRARAEERPTWP